MTKRPAPRRSSLSGSPVTAPAAPARSAEEISGQQQAAESATAPQAPAHPEAKPTRHKVSFYQPRADTDRVRGALLHTMATEGPRTLSQFIHNAVMAEVERLEGTYNEGKPFPPVGARELPQGRPLSS